MHDFFFLHFFKREHRSHFYRSIFLLPSSFVNFPIFVQFTIIVHFSIFVQFSIFVHFFNFCPISFFVHFLSNFHFYLYLSNFGRFFNFCPIFNFVSRDRLKLSILFVFTLEQKSKNYHVRLTRFDVIQ